MDEQRAWWEALFQIHEYAAYPELAQELTAREVDFLEAALSLRAEDQILDLGCGNARHVIALAERGYTADGLEIAEPVVTHVATLLAMTPGNARILEQDMRDLAGLGPYDVVLIMNSTFGFWSDDDHAALLRSIHDILSPGGRILLQCINPYQIGTYMQGYQRGWHAVGPGFVLRESRFNPQQAAIETQYRYIEPGSGEMIHPGEHIRLYTYSELTSMLRAAQLRPIAVFGDATLPAVPFNADSQWQVIIAQKAYAEEGIEP